MPGACLCGWRFRLSPFRDRWGVGQLTTTGAEAGGSKVNLELAGEFWLELETGSLRSETRLLALGSGLSWLFVWLVSTVGMSCSCCEFLAALYFLERFDLEESRRIRPLINWLSDEDFLLAGLGGAFGRVLLLGGFLRKMAVTLERK